MATVQEGIDLSRLRSLDMTGFSLREDGLSCRYEGDILAGSDSTWSSKALPVSLLSPSLPVENYAICLWKTMGVEVNLVCQLDDT